MRAGIQPAASASTASAAPPPSAVSPAGTRPRRGREVSLRRRVIGVPKAGATASPLPLAGEGQGGGLHHDSSCKDALSPPLSRKREREQTAFVATAVRNSTVTSAAT